MCTQREEARKKKHDKVQEGTSRHGLGLGCILRGKGLQALAAFTSRHLLANDIAKYAIAMSRGARFRPYCPLNSMFNSLGSAQSQRQCQLQS